MSVGISTSGATCLLSTSIEILNLKGPLKYVYISTYLGAGADFHTPRAPGSHGNAKYLTTPGL